MKANTSSTTSKSIFHIILGLLLAASLVLGGCGKTVISSSKPSSTSHSSSSSGSGTLKPYTVNGKTYYPLASASGYKAEGMASWYGDKFHGRKTASGERYNMYDMTAAHKTLPMGSIVKVTNLRNGRTVEVRINDRGPFKEGRVIDLSKAAAAKLDIVGAGTERVRVQALSSGTATASSGGSGGSSGGSSTVNTASRGSYYLQIGAFTDKANANDLLMKMRMRGYGRSRVKSAQVSGKNWYRVQIGSFSKLGDARRAQSNLASEFPSSVIITD